MEERYKKALENYSESRFGEALETLGQLMSDLIHIRPSCVSPGCFEKRASAFMEMFSQISVVEAYRGIFGAEDSDDVFTLPLEERKIIAMIGKIRNSENSEAKGRYMERESHLLEKTREFQKIFSGNFYEYVM